MPRYREYQKAKTLLQEHLGNDQRIATGLHGKSSWVVASEIGGFVLFLLIFFVFLML